MIFDVIAVRPWYYFAIVFSSLKIKYETLVSELIRLLPPREQWLACFSVIFAVLQIPFGNSQNFLFFQGFLVKQKI